jgi:hypothetical protein
MATIQKCKVMYYEETIPETLTGFKSWHFTSGGTTGQDFKIFAKVYKKWLKNILPADITICRFERGHYYLFGFLEKQGKYVYFSISDVRHFPNSWAEDILVRIADSPQDYTGGSNNSTTMERFAQDVNKLFERGF